MTETKPNYKKLAVMGVIAVGLGAGVLFGFIDSDDAWKIASGLMTAMGLGG